VFQDKDKHEIECVAFSSDGRWLAAAHLGGYIKVWSVPEWRLAKMLGRYARADVVFWVAFHPRAPRLASLHGAIEVWDVLTGTTMHRFPVRPDAAQTVFYSPDGRWLISGWGIQKRKFVLLLDAKTGKTVRSFESEFHPHAVFLSPDGLLLASTGGHGELAIWELKTSQRLYSRPSSHSIFTSAALAFSPDSQALAFAVLENKVLLVNARTGVLLRTLRGHTYAPLTTKSKQLPPGRR
jgi:WD40 repeat protein